MEEPSDGNQTAASPLRAAETVSDIEQEQEPQAQQQDEQLQGEQLQDEQLQDDQLQDEQLQQEQEMEELRQEETSSKMETGQRRPTSQEAFCKTETFSKTVTGQRKAQKQARLQSQAAEAAAGPQRLGASADEQVKLEPVYTSGESDNKLMRKSDSVAEEEADKWQSKGSSLIFIFLARNGFKNVNHVKSTCFCLLTKSPLHCAVKQRDHAMVQILLAACADQNVIVSGLTPFEYAKELAAKDELAGSDDALATALRYLAPKKNTE